jgi:hypothetical protein
VASAEKWGVERIVYKPGLPGEILHAIYETTGEGEIPEPDLS